MKSLRLCVILLTGALLASSIADANLDGDQFPAPIVTIGDGTVERGASVDIPIFFENHGNWEGFSFDVTFDPSFFDGVDTSRCLDSLTSDGLLAACRRQEWPNQDVIRFLAVSLTGEPIPSGELGKLGFRASENAYFGVSPLELLECTGLAVGTEMDQIPITADDYVAGEIVVFGLDAPTKPAQPEAVLELDGETLFNDNPMYSQQFNITNPIPVLAAGYGELTLKLPDGRLVDVTSKRFIPRDGYVDRLDCRDTQVPDNDSATPLSFRWYGELGENGWLGVTVVNDVLRGSLTTQNRSYQIFGSPEEGYRLAEVNPDEIPSAHGDRLYGQFAKFANPNTKNRLSISASDRLLSTMQSAQSTGPIQLDLLIMYTAQAEADAGGPSALDALIQLSIDNTNQAFVNSDYANLSVREVHRELLLGFVPSGILEEDAEADLELLRINSQIVAARNAHHADLTSVILRNVSNAQGIQELAFCGLAFLQSPTCGEPGGIVGCGLGADFENFAINWVSTTCAALPGRNSFPHEIGHLLGAEHQPGAGQDPADASFPWSYAHLVYPQLPSAP